MPAYHEDTERPLGGGALPFMYDQILMSQSIAVLACTGYSVVGVIVVSFYRAIHTIYDNNMIAHNRNQCVDDALYSHQANYKTLQQYDVLCLICYNIIGHNRADVWVMCPFSQVRRRAARQRCPHLRQYPILYSTIAQATNPTNLTLTGRVRCVPTLV